MRKINKIDLLKRYSSIYVDGSLSVYGGCRACFMYSDGNNKVIKLPRLKDPHITEYTAFIGLLTEINNTLTRRQKNYNIDIITDCHTMYDEIHGKLKRKREPYYTQALTLMNDLNINLIWKPREYNRAGKILDNRIKLMKKYRNKLKKRNLQNKRK